jgi:hypothetical protein
MRRLGPLAALLVALACKDEPPPRAPPPPPRAPGMTARELALATAVDAKLAAFTLAASDVEGLLREGGTQARARGRRLLSQLRVARAEVERAASAVTHPADATLAAGVSARAVRYGDALAAALGRSPPLRPADRAELARAQRELAAAIEAYRRSRSGWRVELPELRGAEREFEEARRELERLEAAPPGAAAAGAARRAQEAAGKLPPALAGPARRYAAAQEKALAALRAGAQATDPRRAAASARAFHAAKAEALAALADYLAALAAR